MLLALAGGAGCTGSSGDPVQAGEPTSTAAGEAPAPNVVQPGAPGEGSQELSPDELDDLEPPKHTAADVAFMQDMIHHHAQALRMAGYVPERATGRDLRLFAKRLEISQEDEITQMARWLEARGEEAFDVHEASDLMPGMLTEAELDRLEAASGRRFNRLFLQGMLRHHQGALTMVADLYEEPENGLEPEIAAFTRHVLTDQQIEISRMQSLLQELVQTRR